MSTRRTYGMSSSSRSPVDGGAGVIGVVLAGADGWLAVALGDALAELDCCDGLTACRFAAAGLAAPVVAGALEVVPVGVPEGVTTLQL